MKALLLAGGKGTRLWPISKINTPKQTLSPFGEEKNLLQLTIERTQLMGFTNNDIFLVTAQEQDSLLQKIWNPYQLGMIISEPEARNTAPAILLATKKLMEQGIDKGESLYVFPTDHYISNFQPDLSINLHDIILCFRIIPTRPETGYGYMQAHTGGKIRKIRKFVEKPNQDLANEWYQSWLENPEGPQEEKLFWNSGIYAFSLNSLGNALEKINNELYHKWISLTYKEFLEYYSQLPTLPFDKLIAERTNNLYSSPLDADIWRDIGSWQSVYEALTTHSNENINIGQGKPIFTEQTKSCLVSSDKNYNIACAGVQDLAVIISGNNILITDKNNPIAMQNLINELNTNHRDLI